MTARDDAETRPGRDAQGTDAGDADASLRFGGTPDRMQVGVTGYVPAKGRGRPLSLELLRHALAAAGVTAPLDEANAAEVVRLLLAGQDARSITIARGVRPQSAQDARFESYCTAQGPVFPGQAFGRLHPAVEPRPGRDVAGNVVPPEDAHPPREISVSGEVDRDKDGVLTARIAGLVRLGEGRLAFEPLIRISPDKLQAMATLFPRAALGGAVTPEGMVQALSGQGVTFGIQLEDIVKGLAHAAAAHAPVEGVIVARGLAPVHGQNGWLEVLCDEHGCAKATVEENENQRLDYRDRGQFPVARKGEDIARLQPPTKGVPGRDIFGREAPARDGAALRVQAGKSVEAVEEGTLFRARIDGVVLSGKASLDVSELLAIPGDVDYGTGNLLLSQGSVRVGGTVRSGFTVEAPGKILVEGMVESARVIAGGDVLVRGGIFMSGDEAAFVQAGGAVTANYTHNAQVQAGGDVTVTLAIVGSKVNKGSRITSGGSVRVTDPKGRIMGGTIVCARVLEVFDAGSERGMATTLVLNQETPAVGALIKEMRELKVLKERSLFMVGEGDGALALARLPGERRDEARSLLGQRDNIEFRIRQIQRILAEMAQDYMARVAAAKIVIRGTAYPGVAIKMGGAALYIEKPLERCVFSWDAKAKQIVTGSL
jgi:uncharacterized protein (DUF342 family)